MKPKLKHTAEQLTLMEFDVALRGYDAVKVDRTLDEIIGDYRAYDRTLAELETQLAEQSEKIAQLQSELDFLKVAQREMLDRESGTANRNYDALVDKMDKLQQLLDKAVDKK